MGQTITFLSPLGSSLNTRLRYLFATLKLFSLSALLVFFIASCSSQRPQKTPQKPLQEVTAQNDGNSTSTKKLALAKNLINEGKQEQAINELIIASELLFLEGTTEPSNYKKSLWLADKTISLINNTPQLDNTNAAQQHYQLMLIKTKSLLALDAEKVDKVHQELISIQAYAVQHSVPLTLSYYQTLSKIWQSKNRQIELVQTELFLFSLQNDLSADEITNNVTSLWNQFSALTPWQVKLLQEKTAPHLKGWLALTNTANKWGGASCSI